MGYKLKDDLSIAENVTHAQKEIAAKADALLEELPQCALNLMKEYENWKSQVEKWNTFANKCQAGKQWTGGEWDSTNGYSQPQWTKNYYSFDNENSSCKWNSPSFTNRFAATVSVWWYFSKRIRVWHADVVKHMGEMPSEQDLLLMKSKKLTDDRTNALYKQIVGANHNNIEHYLGMAQISSATSYTYADTRKLAGIFLPNPGVQDKNYDLGHINGKISAWHPYRWVEGNIHQNLTTAGEQGGGGSEELLALSVKHRNHEAAARSITMNSRNGKACYDQGDRPKDPGTKPADSRGNWQTTNQTHFHDGMVHLANKGTVQYYVGDSNAQTVQDTVKYYHSDATSVYNLMWTFWGDTFYNGTIRWPEVIFWWATPTWNFHQVYMFRNWVTGYIGGRVSNNANYPVVYEDGGHDCYYHPYGPSGMSIYWMPKRCSGSEYGSSWDWARDLYGGYQYGTRSGYHSSGNTPMHQLVENYFELKKAAYNMRDAVGCIVKLDAAYWEARQDLTEFVEAVQADPNLSAEEKAAAQDALDKMKANEGDITRAVSTFTKNLIFREQCYLLAQVGNFADYKKKRDREETPHEDTSHWKRAPYQGDSESSNSSLIVHADTPYGFMNKLTQPKSQEALFDMENWDISTFQPQIRLYKVVFDVNSRSEKEVEVEFDQFADTDRKVILNPGSRAGTTKTILEDKNKRGFGTGIQNFTFTYDGSNPFSAKKSIKAELKIFANSFDELLEYRGSGADMYRYVDLALKTSNTDKKDKCYGWGKGTENEEMAKLNFRLKAVVGWAFPDGAKLDHLSPNVKDAIYNSYVTLNLTPTVHDFSIDEMGRVTFSIKYLAYTDDFFDQNEYDIFNNIDIIEKQVLRRLTIKNNNRTCDSAANENLKEKEMKTIGEEKRQSVSTLMSDMITNDKIYYITANTDEIRNFQSQGPFYTPPGGTKVLNAEERNAALESSISSALDAYEGSNPEAVRDQISAALQVTSPNDFDIPFFFVSDLVDVILKAIGDTLDKMPERLDQYYAPTRKRSTDAADESSSSGFSMPRQNEPYQTIMQGKDHEAVMAANGWKTAPILQVCNIKDNGDDSITVDYEINGKCGLNVFAINRADAEGSVDYSQQGWTEVIFTKKDTSYSTDSSPVSLDGMNPYECDIALKSDKYRRLREQFKKFRIVLGPLELIDRKNDIAKAVVTMADLPISVKYFVEFLTEKLSSKEKSSYSLANFLNDFFNNLMRNFLNDDTCFTDAVDISQKVRVTSAAVTSYREPTSFAGDDILQARINANGYSAEATANFKSNKRSLWGRVTPEEWAKFPMGFMNISGRRDRPGGNLGFDNEVHYMVYFAGRTQPRERMKGDKTEDHAAGIFHYVLGRDKGIVKNISLSKTQTAGLAEVRFEQSGYDGLRQLRVIYDVNIDTYSNVKAFPGTYIYVNPQSFAPTTDVVPCSDLNLTEYGIGGYYMVIRSEHNFAPGDASTKIFAKWVNQLSGEGATGLCGDPVGGRLQKCKSDAPSTGGGDPEVKPS